MVRISMFCPLMFLQHSDDEESEVLSRISAYQAHLEDIQECYEEAQKINADQDLQTVFECIESIVVNQLPTVVEPQ